MLDEKTKELIAIGASVTAHCQPCTTFHVKKAKELGVTDDMIKEAIEVGQTVERGAGDVMNDFLTKKMGVSATNTACCCTDKGCSCSC